MPTKRSGRTLAVMAYGEPAISPLDVEDLRTRVQKSIDEFLTSRTPTLDRVSPDLVPLTDAITALISGGKRLRPAFAYWAWRATGGDDTDAAITAAASLEFLQACALIHDDVMDASDTRRGMPAAHRRFASLHRENEWHGSSEAFGVGAAILLGDLCLSWADELLLTSGLPQDALMRAKPIYDDMRTELMAGQYLDLLEQARGGGSVERALQVVRYKSAKYTIERPLHLGATLAGGDAITRESLSRYGLPLGEAFQLRDDVLGVFGDPSETGKPAGDDLREGKRTVLIAIAVERATPVQDSALRRQLGDPALDAGGVATLREIIRDTGALAFTEELIAARLAESVSALDAMDVDPLAAQVLAGLAVAATSRSV